MPTTCQNYLTIIGESHEIDRFIELITRPNRDPQGEIIRRGSKYSILDRLIPCPQKLVDTPVQFHPSVDAQIEQLYEANIKEFGNPHWYAWQNTNWGTKWGDYNTRMIDRDFVNMAQFSFSSAWVPPIQGFYHVSTLFPILTFILNFQEENSDYCGSATIENGQVSVKVFNI